MQTSVPELTDLSKEPDAHVRAVRPGRAQAGHVRRELPAGAAAGRARRALHPALPSRLGPAQQSAASRSAGQCQDTDQPSRGADAGSEAARPAGRHAGGLGRRIRPHGLLPGQADAQTITAAIIIRAASRCGWPAAASSPASRYGETDDYCYNIVEGSGARPRPARDDPALPGHRPHAADVQVPGPRTSG